MKRRSRKRSRKNKRRRNASYYGAEKEGKGRRHEEAPQSNEEEEGRAEKEKRGAAKEERGAATNEARTASSKARNVQNGNNRRRTPRTTLSVPVDGGSSTSNVSVQPPSAPGPSTSPPSISVTPSTTVMMAKTSFNVAEEHGFMKIALKISFMMVTARRSSVLSA